MLFDKINRNISALLMSILIDTFALCGRKGRFVYASFMPLRPLYLIINYLCGKITESMKRPFSAPFVAGLFLMLFLLACKRDAGLNQELLLGRWEIQDATRDGKRAPSVDDLYFVFFEDGTMQTNIAGSAETASYKTEENMILQRESRWELDYIIEEISDSSMVLSTELRNAHFLFLLKKAAAEE